MDVVKYIFMTIIVSLALIGLGFWIENPLPIVVGMGIFVLVGYSCYGMPRIPHSNSS